MAKSAKKASAEGSPTTEGSEVQVEGNAPTVDTNVHGKPMKEVKVLKFYHIEFRLDDKKPWEDEGLAFATEVDAKAYLRTLWNPKDALQGVQVAGEYRIINTSILEKIQANVNGREVKKVYAFEYWMALNNKRLKVQVVTNVAPNPEASNQLAKREGTLWATFTDVYATTGSLFKAQEACVKEHKFNFRLIHMNEPPVLLNHLAETKGAQWRIERFPFRELDDFGDFNTIIDEDGAEILKQRASQGWITRANVTSSGVTLMFVHGVTWDQWDEYSGTFTLNSDKITKRNAEDYRSSEFHVVGIPGLIKGIMLEDHPLGEMAYDGCSVLSVSFAKKVISQSKGNSTKKRKAIKALNSGVFESGNIRGMLKKLLKGDYVIAPDQQLMEKYGKYVDIVTHAVNFKKEKGGVSKNIVTLTPHHRHTEPNVSAQVFSWALDMLGGEDLFKATLKAKNAEFENNLRRDTYQDDDVSADTHDDELVDDLGKGFKDTLATQAQQWNMAGFKTDQTTFLTLRKVEGRLNKLSKDGDGMRYPAPWGSLNYVTPLAIIEAAGYDLSGIDTTKEFYHFPTGRWVIPTAQYIQQYPRKGGWDADDAQVCNLRIEDGAWRNIGIRYPNALTYFKGQDTAGEYSIGEVDMQFKPLHLNILGAVVEIPTTLTPIYNIYGPVPELDRTKQPFTNGRVQKVDFEDCDCADPKHVNKHVPKESVVLDPKFSQADVVRLIDLQMENPGIGPLINALIGYQATFNTFPVWMPFNLEVAVDATEQKPDREVFKLIEKTIKYIKESIAGADVPVSRTIGYRRLTGKLYRKLNGTGRITENTPFDRLVEEIRTEEDRMRVQWFGKQAKGDKAIIGEAAKRRRPIDGLMSIEVSEPAMKVARTLVEWYLGQARHCPKFEVKRNGWGEPILDDRKRVIVNRKSKYVAYAKRCFFESLNDKIVSIIMGTIEEKPHSFKTLDLTGLDHHEVMVGMYQYITNTKKPDNVIFLTSSNGVGLFDLFMETCMHYGVSKRIMLADGTVIIK